MICGYETGFIWQCLLYHYLFSSALCFPVFLLTLTTRLRWLWGSRTSVFFMFLFFAFLALGWHLSEDFLPIVQEFTKWIGMGTF